MQNDSRWRELENRHSTRMAHLKEWQSQPAEIPGNQRSISEMRSARLTSDGDEDAEDAAAAAVAVEYVESDLGSLA